VLGPCDGYAIERGYDEYVIAEPGSGRLVDRWSGAPLLNSTEALSATVAAAPRTWFVADGFRLATRYSGETLRFLLTHFDPVIEEAGVVALRSDGLRQTPFLDTTLPISAPVALGPLQLLQARRNSNFGPNSPLVVDLEWTANQTIGAQINTSVRLVNRAGEVVAQDDGPPARGIIPTTLFFDTPLPDTKVLTLPVDLPNERYRIDVAAYEISPPGADGQSGLRALGEPLPLGWFLYATNHAPLTPPLGAWQNGVTLLGASVDAPALVAGADLGVQLVWIANQPTPAPLTAFVHLLGPDGAVVAQHDKQPEDGFFPTSAWTVGTGPVDDAFLLPLPSVLAPGAYRLVTGWYDAATGARLPTQDGGDSIEVATFNVE
ncbi:MAG: hypothetical protein ACRC1H_09830, partial [Caldilineaceae bacterium]